MNQPYHLISDMVKGTTMRRTWLRHIEGRCTNVITDETHMSRPGI